MDLIADTNIWHDITEGRKDPSSLKSGGNRFLVTLIMS